MFASVNNSFALARVGALPIHLGLTVYSLFVDAKNKKNTFRRKKEGGVSQAPEVYE